MKTLIILLTQKHAAPTELGQNKEERYYKYTTPDGAWNGGENVYYKYAAPDGASKWL